MCVHMRAQLKDKIKHNLRTNNRNTENKTITNYVDIITKHTILFSADQITQQV